MTESSHKTAMLTTAQREYLQGERPNYSQREQRNIELRIRRRILATAAFDAPLLLDVTQGSSVIDSPSKVVPDGESEQEMKNAFRSLAALAYRLADISGFDAEAILDSARDEAERGRLYAILKDDPAELTFGQLRELIDSGDLSEADALEFARTQFEYDGKGDPEFVEKRLAEMQLGIDTDSVDE